MFTALSIAGSDSGGGAGIQADIKTMCAHGVFAMTAVTALTAQNTTGVFDIMEATPDFLCKQLDAVFTDIYPDAVKIGMLSGVEIMKAVASKLIQYKARHIVLDPVMVATSGAGLMKEGSTEYMMNELFPIAEIITPNIPETQALSGMKIENYEDMKKAGLWLYDCIKNKKDELLSKGDVDDKLANMLKVDTAVLIKGGHSINDADDLLISEGKMILIKGERIDNPNTHGTGCTLSSAIASNLAKGKNVEEAVRNAKAYISKALSCQLDLGKGSGPLNHVIIPES